MSSAALVFLLILLAAAFLSLFGFSIARKLCAAAREKRAVLDREKIKAGIDKLTALGEEEFSAGLEEFAKELAGNGRDSLAHADDCLLEALEQPGRKKQERLIAIAKGLDFPADCLNQIRSGKTELVAHGSRRAGLYQLGDAAGDMVAALDILSREVQFEILMGLARIGDADALQQAFEKIKDNIAINERAAIEILAAFPAGKNKKKLFRSMIRSDAPYIASLFIKAMDRDIVKPLQKEVVSILGEGGKEERISAVKALAVLGANAPPQELINALSDKEWEVRALAAKALGPVLTPEASYALFMALGDNQWWVRQNAASSLIGHPNYEALFILAAETGDEYTKDSILSVLENGNNPLLLKSIRILVA